MGSYPRKTPKNCSLRGCSERTWTVPRRGTSYRPMTAARRTGRGERLWGGPVLVIAIASAVAGCTRDGRRTLGSGLVATPSASAATSAGAPPPSDLGTPGAIPADLARIVGSACEAVCVRAGDAVQIFRDEAGVPQRGVITGTVCAHSPTLFLNAEGITTETIESRPVVRGSPEAAAFAARRERQVAGLHAAERVRCPARAGSPLACVERQGSCRCEGASFSAPSGRSSALREDRRASPRAGAPSRAMRVSGRWRWGCAVA